MIYESSSEISAKSKKIKEIALVEQPNKLFTYNSNKYLLKPPLFFVISPSYCVSKIS